MTIYLTPPILTVKDGPAASPFGDLSDKFCHTCESNHWSN